MFLKGVFEESLCNKMVKKWNYVILNGDIGLLLLEVYQSYFRYGWYF